MSETARRYRIADEANEQWFDDLAAAHAAIAARLGLEAGDVEASGRRVTVDPVVVRHEDARWRSRSAWIYRSPSATARLLEMLRIDEAVYDH
jgi:hypothetical protein